MAIPDPSIFKTLNYLAAIDKPLSIPVEEITVKDRWDSDAAPSIPAGVTEANPEEKAAMGVKLGTSLARIRFASPIECGPGWRVRLKNPRTDEDRVFIAKSGTENVAGWDKLWVVTCIESKV